MKNLKTIVCLLLCLMIAASACLLVSCANGKATEKEEKEVTFTFYVVDKEGERTDFSITTRKTTLREVLVEEKLISGDEGDYGLMVDTVNGIRADYQKDGAYWALYIGDEMAMTGVDGVEVSEGGIYGFVYTLL